MASRRGAQRGFSLIELVAVVVVMALLAVVLFRLTLDYAEEAEKIAMEQVAAQARAAMHLRIAGLLARHNEAAIPTLAQQNPMNWLSEKPGIYAGEIYGVAPADLAPPRSWYYDTRAGELVYRPARTRHLEINGGNQEKEIRFKMVIEQGALPGATGLRGISRAELLPVSAYAWRTGS